MFIFKRNIVTDILLLDFLKFQILISVLAVKSSIGRLFFCDNNSFLLFFLTNQCFCLYKQEGNNFHNKHTKCCQGKTECGQIGVDERKKARICETWGDTKKDWGKAANTETMLWCEGVCGGVGCYRPYLFHLLHSFSSPLMAFPWGRRDSRNHAVYRPTPLCSHETQYTTVTEPHTATALGWKLHTAAMNKVM